MKTMRYSPYQTQATEAGINTQPKFLQMMQLVTMMDNKANGMGADLEGELLLAEPVTKTKRPPMYKVVLLNDDFTPMDFVVSVIEHIFRKDHEEAVSLMLQVHEKGQAIVGVYTREVAETKVDQVIEYARINEHPLQCAMEQE